MKLTKVSESEGRHIVGYQCDVCGKTSEGDLIPMAWAYTTGSEHLCIGCLTDEYIRLKDENTELCLTLKQLVKLANEKIAEIRELIESGGSHG